MNPDLVPSLIIVVAVAGAGWLASTMMPPTLQFGVRVPPDRAREAIIGELRRMFRVGLLLGALLAAAITFAVSLTAPRGAVVIVAPVFALLFTGGVYYVVHSRLARVKAAEAWYAGQRIGAATALPGSRSWRWAFWLGPALAITVATAIIGAVDYSSMPARLPVHFGLDGSIDRYVDKSLVAVFWLVVVQFLMTALLGAILWSIQGSRFELDPAAPEESFEHQQRFRGAMTGALGFLIVALDAAFLVTSLATWDIISGSRWVIPVAVLALSVIPAVALVLVAVKMGAQGWRMRRQGESAAAAGTNPRPALVQRDDDRFWKGGMLYWNRDDPAFFVSKRFGAGWTMNFAHPVAWLFLAVPVAIVVVSIVAARGGVG